MMRHISKASADNLGDSTLHTPINRGTQLLTEHPYSYIGSGVLDSEGFAVFSNVKFLYLIGKICSEANQYPEDGLNALNDYLLLVEYFREDIAEETYQKLKVKTLYCIGMIFY